MAKSLENQNSLILWGAKDLGRAVALALARRGSAVAIADPQEAALDAVVTLLMSKRADAFALPTPALETAEGEALTHAMERALEKVRASFSHCHRVILCAGVDERLWERGGGEAAPAAGHSAGVDPCPARVDLAARAVIRWLAEQNPPGRFYALWPLLLDDFADADRARAVNTGLALLRRAGEEAARRGVAMSVARIGPCDAGPWKEAAATPLLRSGEVGDAVALLAEAPRRALFREIALVAAPEKAGAGEE